MRYYFTTLLMLVAFSLNAQQLKDNPYQLFQKKWNVKQIEKLLNQPQLTSPCVKIWEAGCDCSEYQPPHPLTPLWLLEATDLSNVWISDSYLACRGDNYQRLLIHIKQAEKINIDKYHIKGTITIESISQNFDGTLRINAATHRQGDECENASTEEIYDIFGAYSLQLADTSPQKSKYQSIKGVFFTSVYELDDEVMENTLGSYCDGWYGNQFKGWICDNSNKAIEKINFGIARIPDSGDLDIGVGEFHPNEKYYPYGWQSYNEELLAEQTIEGFEEFHRSDTLADGTISLSIFRIIPSRDEDKIMDLEISFMKNQKETRSFHPNLENLFIPNESSWSMVGNVTMSDVNFDGYLDVLIYLGSFGVRFEECYACYLFNPQARRYVYNRQYQQLTSPTPDEKSKTIRSGGRTSYIDEEFTYYSWQEYQLVPIRRTTGTMLNNQCMQYTEYEYNPTTDGWIEKRSWKE